MNCDGCMWWSEFRRDECEAVGTCHRWPPVLDANYISDERDSASDGLCWVRPVTHESEFCGEYAQRVTTDID